MAVVFILLGAFLGEAARHDLGFVLGALVGWLLARSLRQGREIADLRRQLGAAAGAVEGPAQPGAAREAGPATPLGEAAEAQPRSPFMLPERATEAPPAESTSPMASPAVQPLGGEAAAPADAAGAPALQPLPPAPAWMLSLKQTLRDWIFGGNTIVKAGVAILFIGLAFLAKLASEHVHLPPELRLAAIAGVALALLVVGWRLRERRPGYAQVLQGGAIAALYLTLFSAFRFYDVIGAGGAFALMALVAVLAAALAVLQNAAALAVVGALGGFATPLLLSTGGGSHIGLFSYYLLLDLGIAAVAWARTWRALNMVGFVFTFGVGTTWGLLKYQGEQHYLSAQLFLIAFFLVFVAVLLLPARRVRAAAEGDAAGEPAPGPQVRRVDQWVNGSLLFGLPAVVFALQAGLVHHMPYGLALSALAGAAFYVALARWLSRRPQLALAFEGSLAVGTVLLTLVIPFALDMRATAGAWALEGAGLVWIGWRQGRRLARAMGYLLLLIAGFLLLHAVDRHPAPASWLNGTLLTGLLVMAGSLLGAWFVHRNAVATPAAADAEGAAPVVAGEGLAEGWLIVWSLLAAALLLPLHVLNLVETEGRLAALVAGTALVALVYVVLAARLAWRGAALPVLGYVPLLLLFALISADVEVQPLAHGGWWAWPIALAVHLASLRGCDAPWPARGRHAAHALGAVLLATLLALLGRGLLRAGGDAGSAWPWLGWLAAPALLLLLLPRASERSPWPLRLQPLAYARTAAAVVAASLLAWVLLANAVSNGAAEPLPYLPLLNPLDLGVAWALFACWRFTQSEAARGFVEGRRRLGLAALSAIGFFWLNAMLVRGFHHYGGVPFHVSSWFDSTAVQTGFTLLWSAAALVLMWVSARRALRTPWMVGAALLGLVVAKLLLIDLSASGTVTRIVSFIGAGVLMLIIGYVAPLPARAAPAAQEDDHVQR